jgi:hypothetical protein
VQQHFNDISMRIRSMFVTILLALFAAIGFLVDKRITLEVFGLKVQYATLLPLFGIVGTVLFYFIDRYWYHRLLVGSVIHGRKIEDMHKDTLPELSLTEAISAESPCTPGPFVRFVARVVLVREEKFRDTGKLHSDGKIELFYKSVILILLITSAILAMLGGVTFSRDSAQPSPATRKEQSAPAPVAVPPGTRSPAPASPPQTPTPATPDRQSGSPGG